MPDTRTNVRFAGLNDRVDREPALRTLERALSIHTDPSSHGGPPRARAEEILCDPGAHIASFADPAEARHLVQRLERNGIHCDMATAEDNADGEDEATPLFGSDAGFREMRQCPHCGERQEAERQTCVACGHAMDDTRPRPAPRRRAPAAESPAVPAGRPDADTTHEGPGYHTRPVLPGRVSLVLLTVALVGGGYSLWGPELAPPDEDPETPSSIISPELAESESAGPTYDPEAGVNPYAERLEELGVDTEQMQDAVGASDAVPQLDRTMEVEEHE
ncbi:MULTISPECIES: Ran-binding zinc finger domain-containing protein [unclassified Thioalkalivibrio]|uniref:zinc finger Ran-binding domain-containing protein n=1 Tax=unclassified Thioalkalivibrio TaxID=2621013 RepID=UPI0003736BEA|nr:MULTISPECIES: Ran-binding zinc finger domain-containing protein [unclassified Thioalkalivibrio]